MRKLKVLNLLFYQPLRAQEASLMPRELLDRLFCNLDEVLELHIEYNQKMKERIKSSGFPIGNIADILQQMVSTIIYFHFSHRVINDLKKCTRRGVVEVLIVRSRSPLGPYIMCNDTLPVV